MTAVPPDLTKLPTPEADEDETLRNEVNQLRQQQTSLVEQLNDERIKTNVYAEKLKEVEKEAMDLRFLATKLNIEISQLRQLTMGNAEPVQPAPPAAMKRASKARLKSSTAQQKG